MNTTEEKFKNLLKEQAYIEDLIKNGDDDISLKKRLKEINREKAELKEIMDNI